MKPGTGLSRLCSGSVLLAIAAAFYVAADNLPPGALFEQVGTAFFPKLLADFLAILSVLLMASARCLRSQVVPPPAEANEVVEDEPRDRQAFYGTLAVILLAIPAWSALGLFATPLIMAGTMVANGARRPGQIVAVSLAATVVVYLVFFRLFMVPAPLGLFGR